MKIDFLFYRDCPSHDVALARLRDVLAEEGLSANIEVSEVMTEAEAQALRFVGSPTIRINGDDIVSPGPNAYYALTCRVYQKADGRVTPLPPVDVIRRALQAAV